MTRPAHRSRLIPGITLSVVAVLAGRFPNPARADSWMAPRTFRVASDNGRFTAVVDPGGKGKAARARVFEGREAPGKQPLREFPLSNAVAPTALIVSDDGRHVVIRPLAYVEEGDLEVYAQARGFPIIPCDLCGSQEQLQRKQVKAMLREWERASPGRLDTIFNALANVAPSHLLDRQLHDFARLFPDALPTTFPIRVSK